MVQVKTLGNYLRKNLHGDNTSMYLKKMSRPKSQEGSQKPKIASFGSDLRNRSTLRQMNDKAVAEISMKDFLDFLKISYQVNEAIDNPSLDVTEKGSVDWKKLTSDSLINRLKEREALLSKQKIGKSNSESQESGENGQSFEKNEISDENNSQTVNHPSHRYSEEKVSEPTEKPPEFISCESLNAHGDRKSEKLGRRKIQSYKKESSNESETSRSVESCDDRTPARQLKKKLNEALQEGILDSVLPYLLPKTFTQESTQTNTRKSFDAKKHGNGNLEKSCLGSKEKSEGRRKALTNNEYLDKNEKDVEIIIHVCDEIKNLKKDFKCSQKLLLKEMGYFAEVTAGQKLEDMDISVHCDITIFEWLMQWIQKNNLSQEFWPILDSTIVIPVLMSSAFLQINSLHDFCLNYCKEHINEIIRDSPNLNCINDNVLTRLAGFFSNTDVENISDKKDRIQSKLFCKLIVALTEPEPQTSRGHYSSLATIYRCSKCLKLILKNKSNSMLCVASNMKVDRFGTIHSTHVYDSSWSLTDYIKDLKIELKSWRRVYWRLWADCHLLFCQTCDEYFAVGHMNWCRFHTDTVQYFPLENQRSVFHSIGRYSCCGERVYRFETVKKNGGCQFRDHAVVSKNHSDKEILKIWNRHRDVIVKDPPPLGETEKVKIVRTEERGLKKSPPGETFWWEGIEIVPSKQPSGFLNKVWDTVIKRDDSKNAVASNSENKNQKQKPTQQNSIQDMSSLSDSSDESSSSSNAVNSEESSHGSKETTKTKLGGIHNSWFSNRTGILTPFLHRLSYIRKERKKKKKKKKKNMNLKNEGNRFWLSKLSTRCNQDNQREFEERALRQIECVLAKKLSGETLKGPGNRNSSQVVPSGGIYVKLEQEWREAHCFSHGCPGSSIKAKGSASHTAVINNSTFSLHRRSKSRGHR